MGSLVLVVLLLPAADDRGAPAYPRADLLIEAEELATPAALRECVVLDARPRAAYDAGHVPGALRMDYDKLWKAPLTGADDSWTEWSRDRQAPVELPKPRK